MPARKTATKARKAKKKAVKKVVKKVMKKVVKKAVKSASRKAAVRTKAKGRKAPARKATKRTKAGERAARKAVRPAPKTGKKAAKTKVVKKKAAARPKKSRAASKTVVSRKVAARKAAAPRRAAKAARPKAIGKSIGKKAGTARPKAAPRPAAGRGKYPKLVAVAPRFRRPVETALAEDEEGYEPDFHRNLLLGPRNVQPYVARQGEAYMAKEQLEHFRSILSNWKRDLMEEVDRTMNHMKDEAANPPDPNDRATLESEFALELRTRDRERKLIRKIDEALKRIDDSSYGYCLETGEPIGIKRLEARPVATLCIEAQERRERREKQYGDRDDWYR
jgi:DnaK suppressor protein